MKLTQAQKVWIMQNRGQLRELFDGAIEDLKSDILICPEEERFLKIDLANEFKKFMKRIKVVEDNRAADHKEVPKGV
jgi:hypothetical protein|tara:strand:- start:17032 stop:17262 length:231 start_codon:yes stop_codon:yes gene_type:complete